MMIKRALSSSEEPSVQLLEPGRMIKTAGMLPLVDEFISTLRPDPKFVYTLVNAMGYSEFYGPNSNRDWYGHNDFLDFNGLLHTPEDCSNHGEYQGWQTDPVVQSRVAKTWPFGYPSFYGASVYAHHKNSDPASLGFGDVVFAAQNEAMKRIELVMRVDIGLAHQRGHSAILSRISRGDRVDVSMGCKVPFDLCSICTDWDAVKCAWKGYDKKRHSSPGIPILAYHRTHRPIRGLAVTKADYCEHMVGMPGQTLPDGQRVFVYNDFPKFFDISFVWVGADKTARVMWSMGSALSSGMKARPSSLGELMKGAADMTKVASASEKSAEIEKEVAGGISRKIELCANDEMDLPFGPLADFSKAFGARTLLSTLAGLGIPLKPQEFHAVISVEHPLQDTISKMAAEYHLTFSTQLPGYSREYVVSPELFSVKLAKQLLDLLDARSSFAPHLHYRLATAQKTASAPVAQTIDAIFVHDVAAAYTGYRGSLVKEAAGLFPRYFEVMPPTPNDLMKSASFAGLLLSPHAVVHWISAHLNKVAGVEDGVDAAMKYVMASPKYSRLSAFGSELCQQMGPKNNFFSALKTAATTAL